MNKDSMALIRIRREIEDELTLLERLPVEYASIPSHIEEWIRVRTKASLLHDFYTGLERVFSRIAEELNGGIPNTEQWHRDLLKDMSLDLEGIRPPVISQALFRDLLPFLKFRHVFRNLYRFELDWARMSALDTDFPAISARSFSEIRTFLEWMKAAAQI